MNNNKRLWRTSTKSTALLVSILLLICVTLGGTIAYIFTSDGPLKNIFSPSVVSTAISETFENGTKTNVQIQNTGDTSAWIRAAVVVTWKDGPNGNIYNKAPVEGTDYTVTWNQTDWIYSNPENGGDGFWYYKNPVPALDGNPETEFTSALIVSCKPVENKTPEGYYLNVEILGSGLQSKPAKVFNDNWGPSSKLSVQNSNDTNPMDWYLG